MKKELKGIDGKVAIHCPSEAEAKAYCKIMHDAGQMWPTTGPRYQSYLEDNKWSVNLENTVYYPSKNQYGHISYVEEGYTIIPASEFIAMNTEPGHNSKIVGADMICPITKKHCDDECCTIGSECNMSGDGISNTEPEPDKEVQKPPLGLMPEWRWKELRLEEIEAAMVRYINDGAVVPEEWFSERDKLMEELSKRFLLQCQDGLVTDPEQWVWMISGDGQREIQADKALIMGHTCFTTESAALSHRLNNTPAIKLSDMIYDASTGYYVIHKEGAHNLVNERINGK